MMSTSNNNRSIRKSKLNTKKPTSNIRKKRSQLTENEANHLKEHLQKTAGESIGDPNVFVYILLKELAQGAPAAFSIDFNEDLIRKCKGIGPASSRSMIH